MSNSQHVPAKYRFEDAIRRAILRECRRRKTGGRIVLGHVVSVVNEVGKQKYGKQFCKYQREDRSRATTTCAFGTPSTPSVDLAGTSTLGYG